MTEGIAPHLTFDNSAAMATMGNAAPETAVVAGTAPHSTTASANPAAVTTTTATNNQRYRYQAEIQAMMYTFGDVRNPFPAVTLLVEDIVLNQILELLLKASNVASRRGARAITSEDLLFLIRHDVNRSARLKEFLSWKDVRKNARSSANETGGGGAGGSSASGSSGGADDSALVAEIEEDAKLFLATDCNSGGSGSAMGISTGSASTSASNTSTATTAAASNESSSIQIGPKKRQLGLFWDLGQAFLSDIPGMAASNSPGFSLLSYTIEASQRDTLRRLRQADLLTRTMSQSEYLEYSECRQASFTFKKARKFRDWLLAGTARPGGLSLLTVADGAARDLARLNDETLEILGFLAYEMVQKITEVSLAVKYEQEILLPKANGATKSGKRNTAQPANTKNTASSKSRMANVFGGTSPEESSPVGGANASTNATTTTTSTNASATNVSPKAPVKKSAIQVSHVEEGFRRLMGPAMNSFQLANSAFNKRRKFVL